MEKEFLKRRSLKGRNKINKRGTPEKKREEAVEAVRGRERGRSRVSM